MPVPTPGPGEMRIRVLACGVCRTDLHILDGDLPARRFPLVPGHEAVGAVVELGDGVTGFSLGDRVGVPWLGTTCRSCEFCQRGRENLCDNAQFTGYDRQGGYAEFIVADARYCFNLPTRYDDVHAAPLLCAGLIGYRAYAMAGNAQTLGLYGFGAAAHILAQIAVRRGQEVFAFTRPGDRRSQDFARSLGAAWAGGSDQDAPTALDAAILFAPAGELLPLALRAVKKGGIVVCAGIHMSDIPAFPYALLWGERTVKSVANLTRADGEAFFREIRDFDLKTSVTPYALFEANRAIQDLRDGRIDGAAVIRIGRDGAI